MFVWGCFSQSGEMYYSFPPLCGCFLSWRQGCSSTEIFWFLCFLIVVTFHRFMRLSPIVTLRWFTNSYFKISLVSVPKYGFFNGWLFPSGDAERKVFAHPLIWRKGFLFYLAGRYIPLFCFFFLHYPISKGCFSLLFNFLFPQKKDFSKTATSNHVHY